MQQIAYDGEKLITRHINTPKPYGFDLLVAVNAIAINPVDVKLKNAFIPSKQNPFKVLGYDAVGIVKAVGEQVKSFAIGDQVFYAGQLDRDGCNATLQLVDERIVALAPKTVTLAQSAALPLTAITAWEMLFERLAIPINEENIKVNANNNNKEQSILLIGAAGGVGSIAIQLIKKLTKLNVIATASRPVSKEWCRKMGADVVINHHGIDNYFDTHSAPEFIACLSAPDDYFSLMIKVIKPHGKICLLANAEQPHDINLLKNKSISLVWEFMATRTMLKTDDLSKQGEILTKVAALVDGGDLSSTLTDTLTGINEQTINEAHKRISKGDIIGKLVLMS